MDSSKLVENIKTFYDEIIKKKPADLKGEYIGSMYISSTMGLGVKINSKTVA
jgi:large subunit ribosomal protein L1